MIKTKKQSMIIVGAFVIALMLFTTTYAFFNYTRTGTANTIKTGRIAFNSRQGTAINLTNMFPIDPTVQGIMNDSTKVGTITINVTGDTTYTEGLEYLVTAVNVQNTVGGKSLPISIDFSVESNTNNNPATTLGTSSSDYYNDRGGNTSYYSVLASDTISTDDRLLVGYIAPGSDGVDGNIVIKAYLDKDKIAITDTYDGNETDNMGTTNDWVNERVTLTTEEWNSLQTNGISFQVKVEANEGIWVPEPGVLKVRKAILAKEADTNVQCSNIRYEDDGIIYLSGSNDCIDMNYIWYSGKLWRITAIYPDGSMKLVTENSITTISFNGYGLVDFYTNENTSSYMYQWLNEDFYDTLYNTNSIVENIAWNYSMDENSTPVKPETLATQRTKVAPVGLLNAYEYYNAYKNTSQSSNYLNIGYRWWLLNPYRSTNVWSVYNDGVEDYNGVAGMIGVRPSIVIKSGLEFTGDGTISSPYRIVGDKDAGITNELINTRMSGEYVKLKNASNEQLFRIIGVEENKTKIIAMDYADNGTSYTFATGNTDGVIYGSGLTTTVGEDTVYNYLTGIYYPNLETTYGELFDSGTYYMGQIESGQSYKLGICQDSTSSIKNCIRVNQTGLFNISLPRYGEMFATQQGDSSDYSKSIWLINSYSTSRIWNIGKSNVGSSSSPTNENSVRPTLYLKSTVKILSGSGTEDDPYVVGL